MTKRPTIAFFGFFDVFEDFYPHYGIDQETFATQWADSGNHAWLALVQKEIGDVIWYEASIAPQLTEAKHSRIGIRIRFFKSPWLHRLLWHLYYSKPFSWRLQQKKWLYKLFAGTTSYSALCSLRLWRMLKQDRPQYILAQDYSTGRIDMLVWIGTMLKIPVLTYHAGSVPGTYIGQWSKQWSFNRIDTFILSSHTALEQMKKRWKLSVDQLTVIFSPIRTDQLIPIDRELACQQMDLDPAKCYLLFVGRFDDGIKRISMIMEVWSRLKNKYKDLDLLIAGKGNDEQSLREIAAGYDRQRIHFLGWVTGKDRQRALYNCAHYLVLASIREGLPTVIAESMACGTPVISSDVGGVSELVHEEKTGWLFESGDDAMFTQKLEKALSPATDYAQLRINARQMAVDNVSWKVVARDLTPLFLNRK